MDPINRSAYEAVIEGPRPATRAFNLVAGNAPETGVLHNAEHVAPRLGPSNIGGYVDTLRLSQTTARYEIRRRAPWMLLALGAGIVMVLVGGNFEAAFARNIELALFLPVIVYMSDSIGTETLALFVRELAQQTVTLHQFFLRESVVGIALGLLSGVPMGLFAYWWFGEVRLAITVTIAMIVNGVVAVLTGMLAPLTFAKFGKDPALGTDEITTALSDNLSMLTYLVVAALILF
jgi:magnesium transporter